MKITSGILRGRVFQVPKMEVRPTMGQVREALFSSLGGTCAGLTVLDLFAGSGGLGLEAWSRGAASVTFMEKHPLVWTTLKRNVEALQNDQLGTVECLKGDGFLFPKKARGKSFDLIFIDPPYDLKDAMPLLLSGIKEHSVLTQGGRLVYELRQSDAYEIPPGWEVIREKVYGYARILILMQHDERKDA